MTGSVRVTIGNVRWEKAKNRYRLDWTLHVPDAEKPKQNRLATHPDSDELNAFRTDLVRAVAAGRAIDVPTGLPEGVKRPRQRPSLEEEASRPLWLDIRTRLHKQWNGEGHNGERKGHTVKGWANEWIALIMALLRPDAPALTHKQRQGARDFLRHQLVPAEVWERLAEIDEAKRTAAREAGPKDKQQRYRWARSDRQRAEKEKQHAANHAEWQAFFNRYGMRWYEVDRPAVLRAIAALKLRVDGKPAERQTVTKHTVALNEVLKWAVRTGKLASNPFASLEKSERPSTTTKVKKVDQRRIPPMSRVVALITFCRELALAGDVMAFRVLPYLALLALAGFRPAEARELRVEDLSLPRTGWGLAVIGQRLTSPGRAFTIDGSPHEKGAPKWREPGDSRDVPLPPMLVRILQSHIKRFDLAGADPLVCGEDRLELDTEHIGAVWHKVRAGVFTDPEEARFLTLDSGELRHARATLQLAAGIPQLIVAIWLGHSVVVLNTMYAGVIATRTAGLAEEIERYRSELIPPDYETGGGTVVVPEAVVAHAVVQALQSLGLGDLGAQSIHDLLGKAGIAAAPGA